MYLLPILFYSKYIVFYFVTGKILHHIIKNGFEISAIACLNFNTNQAEEFLEVYKV